MKSETMFRIVSPAAQKMLLAMTVIVSALASCKPRHQQSGLMAGAKDDRQNDPVAQFSSRSKAVLMKMNRPNVVRSRKASDPDNVTPLRFHREATTYKGTVALIFTDTTMVDVVVKLDNEVDFYVRDGGGTFVQKEYVNQVKEQLNEGAPDGFPYIRFDSSYDDYDRYSDAVIARQTDIRVLTNLSNNWLRRNSFSPVTMLVGNKLTLGGGIQVEFANSRHHSDRNGDADGIQKCPEENQPRSICSR